MPTNIQVAKQLLTDVLGLSDSTLDKVIRQIQASGDTTKIQTNSIRQRIGGSSLNLLMKGLDASGRTQGDYEGETDMDAGGDEDPRATEYDVDMDQEREGQEAPGKYDTEHGEEDPFGVDKNKVREGIQFSLKDYLINEENMVSIDLSDPAAATAEVRKMSRIAKNSPDRLRRQQMQDVRDEKAEANKAEGSTKSLQMNIANTKQRLVMLNKRLADQQKREG